MTGKSLVKYRPPRDKHPKAVKLNWKKQKATSEPSVVKIAQLTDEATGEVHDRFRAKNSLGDYVEVNVSCDKSESVKEVLKELRKYGAALTHTRDEQFVQEAVDAEPLDYIRHAARAGWYRNGQQVYVRATGVVGSIPSVETIRPPLAKKGDRAQIAFGKAGSIAAWIDEVAMPARWSSRLILALGASFGAPLVRLLGYQSFGINLFGPSKSGKSTAQVVAGSIVGLGTEAALPSFNTTENAPFLLANQCNDGLLPINEMGLMGPNAFLRLGPLTYALSEGKDRARLAGNVFATDVAHSGWSIIFLLSSEHSLENLALKVRQSRQPGEIARCLDVPAVGGRRKTIFDRRPKGMSDEAFAKWAEQKLVDLRAACKRNHGVVFDAYLRHLIAMGDDLQPRVEALVADFVKRLPLKGADGATKHAAKNFGVLCAGLELAIEAGLLPPPWRVSLIRRAVAMSFLDGLKTTKLRDTTLADAKKVLHRRLKALDLPERKEALSKVHVGMRTMDGPKTLFAIRSAEFVKWFASTAELHAILTWLDGAGAVKKADEAKGPSGKGYEWAVTTPRWPDAKVKCIVFSLPNAD